MKVELKYSSLFNPNLVVSGAEEASFKVPCSVFYLKDDEIVDDKAIADSIQFMDAGDMGFVGLLVDKVFKISDIAEVNEDQTIFKFDGETIFFIDYEVIGEEP